MIRVLHFYKNALPETIGGVEQVIDQIARGTSTLGVTNCVLAPSNNSNNFLTYFNGYELITVKRDFELSSNAFSMQSFSVFKELASKADLIHFHFPWPFADLVNLFTNHKKPSIVTYHSDIVRQNLLLKLYLPLKKHFLNSVNHIVATSPNYLYSSKVLQSYFNKTSVIPIGLDEESYAKPNSDKVQFYRDCFGERFFLFIGSFRYYKGLEYLIVAAKISQLPIVIAGSGHAENELKAMVLSYNLKNVFFLGQISEINKSALLVACYAVIFPSNLRSEAFGVFLLEGAMYSKPLISCEISTGTTFINIDHLTGLVVPPSKPNALADAMIWLWNHPDQAVIMGKQAYARYKELFTAEMMAKSYYELYQKFLNR